MLPNQQPQLVPVSSSSPSPSTNKSSRLRKRAELRVPLPQRAISLAVPLPLPPVATSAQSSASIATATFQQINLSEIVRVNRIGSGAGGTVYKVVHRPSSRVYALKVIYGNHEESSF
ncbi:hypothetical protein V6N11_006130 [Hibiscus sabdariffa]|uniref:Protein kinase domain-containing protein n=1 Tax=Hibiscus sabdariffa TaxID=183260 RepID=A0ABR2RPV6_9ROSI